MLIKRYIKKLTDGSIGGMDFVWNDLGEDVLVVSLIVWFLEGDVWMGGRRRYGFLDGIDGLLDGILYRPVVVI